MRESAKNQSTMLILGDAYAVKSIEERGRLYFLAPLAMRLRHSTIWPSLSQRGPRGDNAFRKGIGSG